MTGDDLLAQIRADMPPDRLPGWYTCSELANGAGVPFMTMTKWLRKGVDTGKYEWMEARVMSGNGNITTKVYRLKPSK
jgi:hypothetical protein